MIRRQRTLILALICGLSALFLGLGCSDETQTGPVVDVGVQDVGASDTAPDTLDNPCFGQPEGAVCDDGDPCTLDDQCSSGQCVGGTNDTCESDDVCMVGTCVAGEGCKFEAAPNDTSCSMACFETASCQEGSCVVDPDTKVSCPAVAKEDGCVESLECDPNTGECSLEIPKPEGTTCDSDDDLCSPEACSADGICEAAGDDNDCSAEKAESVCETWVCDAKDGVCKSTGFVGEISCDDDNACTSNDTCKVDDFNIATCVGTPIPFDDNNPCTDDSCKEGEIIHKPINGLACDPDDPCSPDGTCAEGMCESNTQCECTLDIDCPQPENKCLGVSFCDASGPKPVCAIKPESIVVCDAIDSDCEINACVPATGKCVVQPIDDGTVCNDSNACTLADKCKNGACGGGEDLDCNDGLFCNGKESCDSVKGCQAGQAPETDDGVECTVDTCDEELDAVKHAPNNAVCDNAQYCDGKESCDAQQGCMAGQAPEVSDGVACTQDSCDEDKDVIVNAIDDAFCNNGQYCDGLETCDKDLDCQSGEKPQLDDGVECTKDSCDEELNKVVHMVDDGACDNGQYCDGLETCDAQKGCMAGDAAEVSDGVECTKDSCDEENDVLVHKPDNGLCDDKDVCTDNVCDVKTDCGYPVLANDTLCGDGLWCQEGLCVDKQVCGNDAVEEPEVCDDGEQNGQGDGLCLADCGGVQTCGDGNVQGTEVCDDGEANESGDGACVSDCSGVQLCGDGEVQGSEDCDGANCCACTEEEVNPNQCVLANTTVGEFEEISKLVPKDGAVKDYYGGRVSISGDAMIVGSVSDDDKGTSSGSAYVYTRLDDGWGSEQKILASDGDSGDWFGGYVSIDGDTLVVGSYYDGDNGYASGSAYVFTQHDGVWTEQQKLIASDGDPNDLLGRPVSISGDTFVAGAIGCADNGKMSGSAYVFVRTNGEWSQEQKLLASDGAVSDWFGNSVAISGDTLVVGAYFDDDKGDKSGSAYVYARENGNWTEQQKLVPDDGGAKDQFGYSVAIDGDTLAVGAVEADEAEANAGAVYVYLRENGEWLLEQKLMASDAGLGDKFGFSVSISGDRLAVGNSVSSGSGDTYVFERVNGVWTEKKKLNGKDSASGDKFGSSVSISGVAVAIGAQGDDDKGSASGSAYVFEGGGPNCLTVDTCDCKPGYVGPTCADTACGDGIMAGDEECDDGNLANLDGCADNCSVECGAGHFMADKGNVVFAHAPKLNLNTSSFTLEYWFKPTCSSNIQDGTQRIFIKRSGDDPSTYLSALSNLKDGCRHMLAANGGGPQSTVDQIVHPNVWTHVAWQRTANGLEAFVNGKPVLLKGVDPTVWANVFFDNTAETYVGSVEDYSQANYPQGDFDGSISQLRLRKGTTYDGAFVPDLLLSSDANTVMLVNFDIGTGAAVDVSANALQLKQSTVAVENDGPVCTETECGNGAVEFNEECDDGNADNHDGCSAGCIVEVEASCKVWKELNPKLEDGLYWIDPDGPNGNDPVQAYCDMTVDKGGWTRVFGIEVNDGLFKSANPIDSYTEGLKMAAQGDGHVSLTAMKALRSQMEFSEIRFRCYRDAIGRVVHVQSDEDSVVSFFSNKSASQPAAPGTFTVLPDDNSILSGLSHKWGNECIVCDGGYWGYAPYINSRLYMWSIAVYDVSNWLIREDKNYMSCDDNIEEQGNKSGEWFIYVR
jgi:cysteine-rich repeat protein